VSPDADRNLASPSGRCQKKNSRGREKPFIFILQPRVGRGKKKGRGKSEGSLLLRLVMAEKEKKQEKEKRKSHDLGRDHLMYNLKCLGAWKGAKKRKKKKGEEDAASPFCRSGDGVEKRRKKRERARAHSTFFLAQHDKCMGEKGEKRKKRGGKNMRGLRAVSLPR